MCMKNMEHFYSMLFIMKLSWAFANSNKCINLLDSITKAQKKNILVILNLIWVVLFALDWYNGLSGILFSFNQCYHFNQCVMKSAVCQWYISLNALSDSESHNEKRYNWRFDRYSEWFWAGFNSICSRFNEFDTEMDGVSLIPCEMYILHELFTLFFIPRY